MKRTTITTVGQLIKALQKFNPDMQIGIDTNKYDSCPPEVLSKPRVVKFYKKGTADIIKCVVLDPAGFGDR